MLDLRHLLVIVLVPFALWGCPPSAKQNRRVIEGAVANLTSAIADRNWETVEDLLDQKARQRWGLDSLRKIAASPSPAAQDFFRSYVQMLRTTRVQNVVISGNLARIVLRMQFIWGNVMVEANFPTTWKKNTHRWRLYETNTTMAAIRTEREPIFEQGGKLAQHRGYPPPRKPPAFTNLALPDDADLEPPKCPPGMVGIPGGSAVLRSEGERYLYAGTTVEIKRVPAFCIDRYEATQGVPIDGQVPAANRAGRLPWVDVTWEQARRACRLAGKVLCTRDQWRRAAAGREGRHYPYGEVWDPNACNTDADRLTTHLAPSGLFTRCVTPEGVYDLGGNVSEWAQNRWQKGKSDHELYGGSYHRNTQNVQGLYPFFGWCFHSYGQTSASVHHHPKGISRLDDGFRCCATPIY